MARPADMIGLNLAATATDDPRFTAAEFPPNKLLYLTQLADAHGVGSRDWFGGLASGGLLIAAVDQGATRRSPRVTRPATTTACRSVALRTGQGAEFRAKY